VRHRNPPASFILGKSARTCIPLAVLAATPLVVATLAAADGQRGHAALLQRLQVQPDRSSPQVIVAEYEAHEPTHSARNQTFGTQVALSGDGRTMAVTDLWYYGGPVWPWYGSGAVYVYSRIEGGWELQAKLEPPDARGYDFFGSDLAFSTDGDTLAVGAQYEGYDAPSQEAGPGAVFVFTRRAGQWSQQSAVRSPHPQDGASFGRSVELDARGRVLAVGAPYEAIRSEQGELQQAGAAYVFEKKGAAWIARETLAAPASERHDRFGLGLRLSEDGRTLAILAGEQNDATYDPVTGAWPDRNNTVYVYERTPDWTLQAQFEGAPDDTMLGGDGFDYEGQVEGFDLSGDGRTLAIASPYARAADGESGLVRFYRRLGRHWTPAGQVVPSLSGRVAFGLQVTLSGDGRTMIASMQGAEGPYGRPCVVEFSRVALGWKQSAVMESPAWPAYTSFGNSLASSWNGRILALGSQSYATESSSWGAVFVY